ncbi:hypothetical protein BDY21DRAFT_351899 [Lineolata rhizophorae]|uniref:Secreted protein n=1 Tax=Lineolata rhizophorae TaxID=578093 RepID=A0A6A6NT57_9PEZI|nr:hypothetical protein BDY21DRAFT_351899 [Lineolata rhizophorae]
MAVDDHLFLFFALLCLTHGPCRSFPTASTAHNAKTLCPRGASLTVKFFFQGRRTYLEFPLLPSSIFTRSRIARPSPAPLSLPRLPLWRRPT